MKTVTFTKDQLAAVRSALEEHIEAIKESDSLVDTGTEHYHGSKAYFHTMYAALLSVARQALAQVEAAK